MAEENDYLSELLAEKDSIDPGFVHSVMLLIKEISRVQSLSDIKKSKSPPPGEEANFNGSSGLEESLVVDGLEEAAILPRRREFRRPPEYFENKLEKPIKLAEKVSVPVKQYPRFNFVGKLLGPKGNTFKRLQAHCGCKMSILGRGSMRDKEKEEEFRTSGDPKYEHLSEDLYVLIEVEAPPAQAHARLGEAIEQIKKFLVPDPNDDIRQEQMREIAILQGIDDPAVPPTPPAGRGRAVPLPPPAPRVPIARGGHIVRGAIRGRGVPSPAPTRVTYEHRPPAPGPPGIPRHAAPAPEQYASVFPPSSKSQAPRYGYLVDGYEAYDPAYEYEPAYAEGGEAIYYDYSHAGGEAFEAATYPTAARAPVSAASYKAAPARQPKRVIREGTYPY